MESILEKGAAGEPLSEEEIVRLLSVDDEAGREALLAAARGVRARNSGNRVFLYGFLYLSTYCRNDCHFCFYRRSNAASLRYRKRLPEVVEAATALSDSGVHLIDLTMGEDPAYLEEGGIGRLAELVTAVREAAGLPVMVSPGVVDGAGLRRLRDAGASWYACYQETFHRSRFETIRPHQDFDARLRGKGVARRTGLLVEEGILSGLGESPRDLAWSLVAMREGSADQVRVMSFVPQVGTPLANHPPGDPRVEAKIIAVLRLLFPDRLIPASLDVGGLDGLADRLNAGANVVTSLVPPGRGLAGVARWSLGIDDALRTASSVAPVLRGCGLSIASREEYVRWMEARRGTLVPG